MSYGEQIIYSYIDEIDSLNRSDWKPLESYWIDQFRQWGFEIMNKNKGGNGPEFHNLDTKAKMSKFKIGKKHSITHSNKGKPNFKLRKPKPKGFGEMMKQVRQGVPKPKGMGEKVSKNRNHKKVAENQQKIVLQYDLNGNFVKEWASINLAAEGTNSNASSISKVCRGIFKKTNNFIWKFKYFTPAGQGNKKI